MAAIALSVVWLFGPDEGPVEAQALTPRVTDSSELQHLAMADFRQISWRYDDGDFSYEIVYVDHVDRLVQAIKELHYNPGVNPHNGKQTAQVVAIYVGEPQLDGPYWWATPGLQDSYDFEHGAMTLSWKSQLIWERPDSD